MLKEIIEDALSRGDKLKKDIVGQILKSATLNELVHNRKFAQTIAKVIQTKTEISKSIHKNVHDALKLIKIPSQEQIHAYEKRVIQLERKIDSLGRRVFKSNLKKPARRKR